MDTSDLSHSVLSGLVRKRQELVTEIKGLESRLHALVLDVDALDATIRLFAPKIDVEADDTSVTKISPKSWRRWA